MDALELLARVIAEETGSSTMWSRFEKLKDNITQIASDVLIDNQDEELDGEGAFEDEGHYNGSLQSLHLRDSDGEDASPEANPTEVTYLGLLSLWFRVLWVKFGGAFQFSSFIFPLRMQFLGVNSSVCGWLRRTLAILLSDYGI